MLLVAIFDEQNLQLTIAGFDLTHGVFLLGL
jgi:hypothetical protein